MAHYIIAGPADSEQFARLDRLGDLLVSKLPDSAVVVKLRKSKADWPQVQRNLYKSLGCV